MIDGQVGEWEREVAPGGQAGQTASAGAGREMSRQNDPEQLRDEIEETRAELGDTVDALSQKADVKARVSEKVEDRKAAWRKRREDVKAKVSGARGRVSGATPDEAKRAASQVAQTAKERPFPAIAVALGVGLLIGRAIGRR
jgi:ElaB/YqjD/DUF883 family membrane-anchored ribosome-binding protein